MKGYKYDTFLTEKDKRRYKRNIRKINKARLIAQPLWQTVNTAK